MQITGPYTPAVGVAISVNDPAVYTKANVAVQIQNESDFPLLAVIGGGINSVAPFTAETIATNSATLLVITPQSGGTTGEITLVWLLSGEASPVPDGPLTGTTTIVRGGGSVAFYPSLTGPGESATPGELDQAGAFSVTTPVADTVGVQINDQGSGGIALASQSVPGVSLLDHEPGSGLGNGVTLLSVHNNVSILVGTTGKVIVLGGISGSNPTIKIGADVGDLISFFNKVPAVGPQASGGTLAGVIAGLVALGLFSS